MSVAEVWGSVLGCGEHKGRCGEVCWSVGVGVGKCVGVWETKGEMWGEVWGSVLGCGGGVGAV